MASSTTKQNDTARPAWLLVVIALAMAVSQQRAFAQSGALAALEQELVEVIAQAEKSVVAIAQLSPNAFDKAAPPTPRAPGPRIITNGRQATRSQLDGLERLPLNNTPPSGSGVVIDAPGIVLTQYLVVDPSKQHVVIDVDGRRYSATPLATDPRSGLATLKIDRQNKVPGGPSWDGATGRSPPALTVGQAERLKKGRFVVTLSNPFAIQADGQPTASLGTITNTATKAPAGERLNNTIGKDGSYRTTLHHKGSLIQTDARLGWSANGGALVTIDGRLVGISTSLSMIAGHESPAGYAIPLNKAMRRVVGDLSAGREPEYGLLGVSFDPVPSRSKKTGRVGIRVQDAYAGGPAGRAGMRPNDLILSIDGVETPEPDSLQLVVGGLPAGAETLVKYERNGGDSQSVVRLGKAFVEGQRVVTNRPPSWRGIRVDYPTAVPGEVLAVKAADGSLDPEGCVVVSEVDPGSVSAESGVQRHSYISHVGGKRVTTPDEFYSAVKGSDASVKITFTQALRRPGPAAQPPAVLRPLNR